MKLYEIITEERLFDKDIKGLILTTSGDLLSPEECKDFIERNRSYINYSIYGYAIGNDTVARITRTRYRYKFEWNLKRPPSMNSSVPGFSKSIAKKFIDYSPSLQDLLDLYYSIMQGQMRDDLITAGIFDLCNYTSKTYGDWNEWGGIWSVYKHGLDYDNDQMYTFSVLSDGRVTVETRSSLGVPYYVLPFLKLRHETV